MKSLAIFRAYLPVAIVVAQMFVLSCGGRATSSSVQQPNESREGRVVHYTPPALPAVMATDRERMEYMALHYWRDFNFCDTTTIRSRVMESAFARYIHLLGSMPHEIAERGVKSLMESASQDSVVLYSLIDIGERYLHDPNSPLRNEELYIPLLESVIASPKVDEASKIRPQYQLDMALKNRVGERAADFVITQRDESQLRLSQVDAEFTILLFNNPDCHDCIRVKEFIVEGRDLFARATIVSVYVDSDLELWRSTEYPKGWINGYDKGEVLSRDEVYDLKAIPTLYLLDLEKRVLLKDASIEGVAQYLYRSSNN